MPSPSGLFLITSVKQVHITDARVSAPVLVLARLSGLAPVPVPDLLRGPSGSTGWQVAEGRLCGWLPPIPLAALTRKAACAASSAEDGNAWRPEIGLHVAWTSCTH